MAESIVVLLLVFLCFAIVEHCFVRRNIAAAKAEASEHQREVLKTFCLWQCHSLIWRQSLLTFFPQFTFMSLTPFCKLVFIEASY